MKSAIVSAVVALSDAIHATTVVEGVETLGELEQVMTLGCDMAQGFYFSRARVARGVRVNGQPKRDSGEAPDLRIFRWEALTG